MDLENLNQNKIPQNEDAVLDTLLDCASSPADNPWFATQVLNRTKQEHAAARETFFEKLRRSISITPARLAAASFAILLGSLFLFKTAGLPDSLLSPTNFRTTASLESTEIPDELVVADLEIFIAELNSELWQNETSL
jgi:hypothetical protein